MLADGSGYNNRGGFGGGGDGGYNSFMFEYNSTGSIGKANTGGGGGGSTYYGVERAGDNGGSGIVIIRYSMGTPTTSTTQTIPTNVYLKYTNSGWTASSIENTDLTTKISNLTIKISNLESYVDILSSAIIAQNTQIASLILETNRSKTDINSSTNSLRDKLNSSINTIETFAGQTKTFLSAAKSAIGGAGVSTGGMNTPGSLVIGDLGIFTLTQQDVSEPAPDVTIQTYNTLYLIPP